MAVIMDGFLGPLAPRPDGLASLAEEVVAEIAADRGLVQVDDVASALGVGTRRLQRLFAEYVGAAPTSYVRSLTANTDRKHREPVRG
jgi:transcriptional regulator GlxA family with amidase domain